MASLAVDELVHGLADAMGWPRSRPARVGLGDRAACVGSVAICIDEDAVDAVEDADAAIVLLTECPALMAGGRRRYDSMRMRTSTDPDEWSMASWQTVERPVLDASEMLAGGRDGLDDLLVSALGFSSHGPYVAVPRGETKFVGFVPTEALESVRDAVFDAGAGVIGDYGRCSWSTAGTGTFLGGEAADPVVGHAGRFEQVAETRFETVVPAHLVAAVISAYMEVHPYEEPAFDVYPTDTPSRLVGLGRSCDIADGTGAVITAALSSLLGTGVEASRGRSATGRTRAVVTSHPIAGVLTAVIEDDGLGLVIAADLSPAERALLEDRGLSWISLPSGNIAAFGATHVATVLGRALGVPVTVPSSLRFPTGPAVEVPEDKPTMSIAHEVGVPVRMHFDGGSRGNPGPSAWAWVLYDADGYTVETACEAFGIATNNVAEYQALVHGLQRAVELGLDSLEVFGDSDLVVKQVRGEYKVKSENVRDLHKEAQGLLRQIPTWSISHVLRAKNADADALVNDALDGAAAGR